METARQTKHGQQHPAGVMLNYKWATQKTIIFATEKLFNPTIKMKKAFLIITSVLATTGITTAQNVFWAKNFGGTETSIYNGDRGQGIAVDNSGNVYTTGYYQVSADFGGIQLSNPPQSTVFIAKQNSAGNVVWATGFNSTDALATSISTRIAIDNSGNVYTTGKFNGVITFGGETITPLGQFDPNTRTDIFVAKQDNSGNVLWLKRLGGSGAHEEGSSIAVDNSGNVYVSGYYDHGEFATFPSEFGSISLPHTGSQQNIFVAKLNASGDMVWAKAYGSQTYAYETADGIAVDNGGNVYVAGTFSDVVDFDGITLQAANTSAREAYVIKLDNSGTAQWAERFYGGSDAHVGDITVGTNGKVYVTGYFSYQLNVGSTQLTTSGSGDEDVFVASLNTQDGSTDWAKKFGSSGVNDNGYGIALNSANEVYLTGSFRNTLSLSSGNIISSGGPDAFVIKLNNSGNPVWGKALGGNDGEIGTGVAVNEDSVYVIGSFNSSVADFGTTSLTSYGGFDAFVTKLTDNPTMSVYDFNVGKFNIYPNPTQNTLTLPQMVKKATITDLSGKMTATYENVTKLDLSDLPTGVYLLTLTNDNGQVLQHSKIVKE